MSENQNTQNETPTIPTITIERNGVQLPFVAATFTRGDKKGTVYPCPDFNALLDSENPNAEANALAIINFLGIGTAAKMLTSKLRTNIQKFHEVASADGEFNKDVFVDICSKFVILAKSMADLKEELDAAVGKMTAFTKGKKNLTAEENNQLMGYISTISSLRQQIEDKKRERKTDEDNE